VCAHDYPPEADLSPLIFTEIIPEKFAAVLILVAIKAQVLPIRAIRGIVAGIAILVVHR
jgi:hypothetical protein